MKKEFNKDIEKKSNWNSGNEKPGESKTQLKFSSRLDVVENRMSELEDR
jgi:hypothetical protein